MQLLSQNGFNNIGTDGEEHVLFPDEKFEDAKGVIRSRRRTDTTMTKRTNNSRQNNTQRSKY